MHKNANLSAMRENPYNLDYLGKIEKDQLSIMSMKNLENVIDQARESQVKLKPYASSQNQDDSLMASSVPSRQRDDPHSYIQTPSNKLGGVYKQSPRLYPETNATT